MTRLLCAGVVCAAAALAQPAPPDLLPEHVSIAMQGAPMGDVIYVNTEMAGARKDVKGAPFSAEVVTEFKQTLADGTVIRRKQTGATYRDREGRTRREMPLGPLGPLGIASKPAPPIFIHDPVAGVDYVLESEAKTARKLQSARSIGPGMPRAAITIASSEVSGTVTMAHAESLPSPDSQKVQKQSLGTREIEGVKAEGTRTVITFATGEIGNDRPIEVMTEQWYSPQLQMLVSSTHSDPRTGETTYSLSNVTLADPPRTLFEVPADYQVTDAPVKGERILIHKEISREGK